VSDRQEPSVRARGPRGGPPALAGRALPSGPRRRDPAAGRRPRRGVAAAERLVAPRRSAAQRTARPRRMIPSGLWEHYRGGFYWVLFVALCSTNGPDEGRLMVVYMGCDVDGTPRPGPRPRTSTVEHFLQAVIWEGRRVQRFTHRGPAWPPHHRDNRPFGRPARQARRPARPTPTVRSQHRDRHRSAR